MNEPLRVVWLLRALLLLLGLPALVLAQPAMVATEHVRAELVAHAPQGIGPGNPMWLGLSMRHQPGWHTYWKNAGDSGLPTVLSWHLPDGVSAGEIQWPTPKPLPVGPLLNYGYEGELLLPVALTVPAGFAASALNVKLRADWLVCKEVCIPESGEFALSVPVAAATAGHAGLFASTRERTPQEVSQAVAKARIDAQALVIEITGLPPEAHEKNLRFMPETAGVIADAAPIVQRWNGAAWSARVPLSPQRSASPTGMHAVLVGERGAGMRVRLDIAGPWPGAAQAAPLTATAQAAPLGATAPPAAVTGTAVAAPMAPAVGPISLLMSLGLALFGGVLLNLMPCVFPVLSLKALSLARPGQDRRSRVGAGLAYSAGVVLSFVALAGLLLALRAGGEQLGWGFQLQSPVFVAALAVLFTLIGLNLAGLFDLRGALPGDLASLRARHPLADHALSGVLAVAIASPCTGPFMGAALGTALAFPGWQTLAVFALLGFGMALPYLAISLLPGLARGLPRPGAWMQRFKVAMAFPMFATVVWLVWVLGQQVGIDGVAGLLGVLVALAFMAWALGTPGFGPRTRRGMGGLAAAALVATLAWAWPAVHDPAATPAAAQPAPNARWQAWSPEILARSRAEGRPVFVDFTAAWCVTCQFNKRAVLADAAVLADFDAHNVLLLRADWTRRDAAITQALEGLGRSGVPVYALYAPGTTAPPVLLSEILRAGELRQAIAALQTGA